MLQGTGKGIAVCCKALVRVLIDDALKLAVCCKALVRVVIDDALKLAVCCK